MHFSFFDECQYLFFRFPFYVDIFSCLQLLSLCMVLEFFDYVVIEIPFHSSSCCRDMVQFWILCYQSRLFLTFMLSGSKSVFFDILLVLVIFCKRIEHFTTRQTII